MKLSDAIDGYEDLSGKASDVARQLALAGLALIWIFKTGDPQHTYVPGPPRWPALFMVLTLSFDFLQYFVGSLVYQAIVLNREKQGKKRDDEIEVDDKANRPGRVF